MNESKLRTLVYIFAHTVLLQFVVDIALIAVAFMSYYAAEYNITFVFLVGAVAFIALLILYICVYVFHKSFGLKLFGNQPSEFNSESYVGPEYQHVEYSVGRKNTFTGRRSINARTQTRQNSSIIIVAFVYAIYIGLFGIVQFAIELYRNMSSDARAAAWRAAETNMLERMRSEGAASFFGAPAICGLVIAAALVVSVPVILIDHAIYTPNNVSITLSEMEYSGGRNPQLTFTGDVRSKTKKDIRSVQTVFVIRDAEGNVLAERDVSLHGFGDGTLSRDETCEFYFTVFFDADDPGHVKLAGCSFDELRISVIIKSITYGSGNKREYSEKEFAVKKQ